MTEQRSTVRGRICGDKFQHASREAAIRHSRELYVRNGYMTNVYLCLFCSSWHVGGANLNQRQDQQPEVPAPS